MPPSKRLGDAVASHPDMLLFYHNGRIISSADYCEECSYVFSDIREHSSAEFTLTADVFEKNYPNDALFNALVSNGYIFMKADTVSRSVLEYARRESLTVVNVKQGYPACTTLTFGKSAISSDKGMTAALTSCGIEVTEISNGDISLPPYEYGFIGGASGVFRNTVYFLGDITTHRDHKKITEAIEKEGYDVVSLSDEPLSDLGRIIFID